MVGEDQARAIWQSARAAGEAVTVPALAAASTETTLRYLGLCDWLVDYSEATRVYCGRPANGELCSDHVHNMFLTGGIE